MAPTIKKIFEIFSLAKSIRELTFEYCVSTLAEWHNGKLN